MFFIFSGGGRRRRSPERVRRNFLGGGLNIYIRPKFPPSFFPGFTGPFLRLFKITRNMLNNLLRFKNNLEGFLGYLYSVAGRLGRKTYPTLKHIPKIANTTIVRDAVVILEAHGSVSSMVCRLKTSSALADAFSLEDLLHIPSDTK